MFPAQAGPEFTAARGIRGGRGPPASGHMGGLSQSAISGDFGAAAGAQRQPVEMGTDATSKRDAGALKTAPQAIAQAHSDAQDSSGNSASAGAP